VGIGRIPVAWEASDRLAFPLATDPPASMLTIGSLVAHFRGVGGTLRFLGGCEPPSTMAREPLEFAEQR